MINFGTIRPGKTLYVPFNTFDSNDPSASVTITGLAVTDIEVYKDGNVVQRASDAGYALLDTDGIDFDGTTGIHGISIDLANNTTAGFWAAGAQYTIVISSITVDGATINFIAATFNIGYPDALINTTIATLASQTSFTLTDGPAEDDALNGMSVIIHDVASKVQLGRAIITDYVGSTKTVTLLAGTTFTAVATDNISILPGVPLSATAIANLESQYDGSTGLNGDTFPASQAQVGNIATGSAAVSTVAESDVVTTGTEVNTFAVTDTKDGIYHEITDVAGAMELYYQFDVTADGVGSEVSMWGRLNGGNDVIGVYAYDWIGASWDQIGDMVGSGSTTDVFASFNLLTRHTGTGANLGKVRIRGYAASGLTTATLYLDQAYVSYAIVPVSRTTKGTVSDVGPTTTDFDTDLTEADGIFDDALITFTSGSLAGESKAITAHVNANGNITVDEAFTAAPANGDAFIVYHTHIHPVTQIRDAILADSTPFNGADIAAILADTGTTLPATLATIAGYLDTEIAAILEDTGTTIPAQISALNNIAASDVLTQINAALDTAIAELGVAAPAATPTMRTGLMLLYMMARNKLDVDTTGVDALKVHNDAGAQICSKLITDDGTDYSEAEMS